MADFELRINIFSVQINMNNRNARAILQDAWKDIEEVRQSIAELSPTNRKVRHLTLYTLIRSCGAIELSTKTILFDFACSGLCPRTRAFLERKLLKSPANPDINKMSTTLKSFDPLWSKTFVSLVKTHPDQSELSQSIKTLASLRNQFAHGETISASFNNIRQYYANSWRIVRLFDSVVK